MQSIKQSVELSHPPADELNSGADRFLSSARDFEIRTAEDSGQAQILRAAVNGEIKRLEAERLGITRPLDESKARIMALYRQPLSLLKDALDAYGAKILRYNSEQERIRAEAQAKLDREAAQERARILESAKRAIEKGQENKAQTLEARAAAVVAPIIRTDAPKVAGTQFREVWKFRIRDAGKINAHFTMPDETRIGMIVRSMKADAPSVVGEGLEVYAEKIIASGAPR